MSMPLKTRICGKVPVMLSSGREKTAPVLMLATLADLGADYRLGFIPPFGLEMIHTYSLIHDDLPRWMTTITGGEALLHRAFGEALAILVGDALLTDAFLMFSKAPLSPERIVLLVELAARAAGSGGMVRGQVLDLKNGDRCLGELEEIILGKPLLCSGLLWWVRGLSPEERSLMIWLSLRIGSDSPFKSRTTLQILKQKTKSPSRASRDGRSTQ